MRTFSLIKALSCKIVYFTLFHNMALCKLILILKLNIRVHSDAAG